MARLLCLLSVAFAVATAKPLAPRPAASPWPAEPPTAEQLRSLHEMLPHGAEETSASFDDFLRARGGRFEPLWANHSRAERTANLQYHHAQRQSERRRRMQSERRRTQAWLTGEQLFLDQSAQARRNSTVAP